MILSRGEITKSGIVESGMEASRRSTTYDATIGSIVCEGSEIEGETYEIERRGIVWVVSNERFKFDGTTTGLATLKTTWTHKGVLALNVGVIDPGWEGPLATALVNFSGSKVPIKKGDPFFRVLFMKHKNTSISRVEKSKDQYLQEIIEKSRLFSDTFLHMNSITDEVSKAIFKLPKWAFLLGWITIGAALLALLLPMGLSIWTHAVSDRHDFHALEERVKNLESSKKESKTIGVEVTERQCPKKFCAS